MQRNHDISAIEHNAKSQKNEHSWGTTTELEERRNVNLRENTAITVEPVTLETKEPQLKVTAPKVKSVLQSYSEADLKTAVEISTSTPTSCIVAPVPQTHKELLKKEYEGEIRVAVPVKKKSKKKKSKTSKNSVRKSGKEPPQGETASALDSPAEPVDLKAGASPVEFTDKTTKKEFSSLEPSATLTTAEALSLPNTPMDSGKEPKHGEPEPGNSNAILPVLIMPSAAKEDKEKKKSKKKKRNKKSKKAKKSKSSEEAK